MIKRTVFLLVAIFGIIIAIYGVKLFFLTPFSINHLLARHIIIEALESPEYLTSLGVLEQYGMRSHNGKFSNDSLEKDQKDLKKIIFRAEKFAKKNFNVRNHVNRISKIYFEAMF